MATPPGAISSPTPTPTQTTPDLGFITSSSPSLSSSGAVALTTPFIFNQSQICTEIRDYQEYTTEYNGGEKVMMPLIMSWPTNSAYSQCQPSGWDNPKGKSIAMYFSPAVCPQGWHPQSIGTTTTGTETGALYFANCCKSGYTFQRGGALTRMVSQRMEHIAVCCMSSFGPEDNTSYTATYNATAEGLPTGTGTIILTRGYQVHYPMSIEWRQGQVPTPAITTSPPAATQSKNPDYNFIFSSSKFMQFLAIGLPIIFIVCFLACCGCCCRTRIKRKRRERKARTAGWEDEGRGLELSDMTPSSNLPAPVQAHLTGRPDPNIGYQTGLPVYEEPPPAYRREV